ncbi:MAG: hypothetical protein AAFR05_22995, partial [Bacteroidota bacterium]
MPRVLYALLFLFAFSLIGPYRASAQIIETIEQSVGGGNAGDTGGNDYQQETSGSNASNYDISYDDGGDVALSAADIEALFFFARATAYLVFGLDGNNPFAVAENGGVEFAEYPYDTPQTGLFRQPGEWGFRHRIYAGLHFLNNEQALSG